jgi:hypothetical protein
MKQSEQVHSQHEEQSEAATSEANDEAQHECPELRVLPRKEPVPLAQTTLGPFQRKARNAGITLETVQCLPSAWPFTREDVEDECVFVRLQSRAYPQTTHLGSDQTRNVSAPGQECLFLSGVPCVSLSRSSQSPRPANVLLCRVWAAGTCRSECRDQSGTALG